jgi:tRNA (uracil-5-)-methyltransferase
MSVHRVYPDQYDALLQEKARLTEAAFAEFQPPALEVYSSPTSHFRMRAEFKVWLSGESASYAMYEPGQSKKPFTITAFPVASHTINDLMSKILEAVEASAALRERLFQAEFLTSTLGEAVVTLIYHRPLSDAWISLAETLAQKLQISIIGRSKKQKIVVGRDYVNETFHVNGRDFHYRQVEAAFSQPNAAVCEKMLAWAVTVATPLDGDLLELYCGNGNFTLPLATQFRRVLATEISKSSVSTALTNLEENNISNVEIIRMSSEELTQAMNGVRVFRRLREIDLSDYNFTTLFVDPPRAGLDETTLALAKNYENIIYISCNPQTLHRDLVSLSTTHDLQRFALFDQFPYTDHRECGVLLRRR